MESAGVVEKRVAMATAKNKRRKVFMGLSVEKPATEVWWPGF